MTADISEAIPSLLLETQMEKEALAAVIAVAHVNKGIYSLEQMDPDSEEWQLIFMPFNAEGQAAIAALERAMEIIYPTPRDDDGA